MLYIYSKIVYVPRSLLQIAFRRQSKYSHFIQNFFKRTDIRKIFESETILSWKHGKRWPLDKKIWIICIADSNFYFSVLNTLETVMVARVLNKLYKGAHAPTCFLVLNCRPLTWKNVRACVYVNCLTKDYNLIIYWLKNTIQLLIAFY